MPTGDPGDPCQGSAPRLLAPGASPEQLPLRQGRKWPSSRVQGAPAPAVPGAGLWCR